MIQNMIEPEFDIFTSANIGDLAQVQKIIKFKPEQLDKFNSKGWNSLMYACYSGHYDTVAYLLSRGADPTPIYTPFESINESNTTISNPPLFNLPANTPSNPPSNPPSKPFLPEFSDTKVHDHATVTIIEGPRFSTKVESFMHKSWGSDLVGMTLMPEAIMAKEAGLVFASIALVTDYDCWKDDADGVTHSGVLEIMKKNSSHTINALRLVLPKIQEFDWSVCFAKVDRSVEASFV